MSRCHQDVAQCLRCERYRDAAEVCEYCQRCTGCCNCQDVEHRVRQDLEANDEYNEKA
jgi:hypothetical protein